VKEERRCSGRERDRPRSIYLRQSRQAARPVPCAEAAIRSEEVTEVAASKKLSVINPATGKQLAAVPAVDHALLNKVISLTYRFFALFVLIATELPNAVHMLFPSLRHLLLLLSDNLSWFTRCNRRRLQAFFVFEVGFRQGKPVSAESVWCVSLSRQS
jgi:hypothetical protein